MKKKIYLIVYAIVQFLVSAYYGIFAKQIAQKQVDAMMEMVSSLPKQLKDVLGGMYSYETIYASIILTAVVGAILALILLVIFSKNQVGRKKILSIILVTVSILLFGNSLIILLGVIALVIIGTIPKVDYKKEIRDERRSLEKLEKMDISKKDIILTIILMLLYFTQFFIKNLSPIVTIIVAIIYYIGIFVFAFFVFSKRLKRDFKAYKSDVALHVGQSFKWWAILIGVSYLAAIIRLLLGGAVVTANQMGLNEAPLWYVAPLAILWAPFVEEIIFRGCIRRFIKNDVLFVIVSGLIFGLLHTIGSEVGIYQMIIQSLQYVAMGVIMAIAYVKTNNIFINMSVHCIQNTLSTFLILFM